MEVAASYGAPELWRCAAGVEVLAFERPAIRGPKW